MDLRFTFCPFTMVLLFLSYLFWFISKLAEFIVKLFFHVGHMDAMFSEFFYVENVYILPLKLYLGWVYYNWVSFSSYPQTICRHCLFSDIECCKAWCQFYFFLPSFILIQQVYTYHIWIHICIFPYIVCVYICIHVCISIQLKEKMGKGDAYLIILDTNSLAFYIIPLWISIYIVLF